ncbi:MAG: hypothetical protein ACOCUU_03020 [Nanoarchaeota archaeon]
MAETKDKNWIKKHPIITGILAVPLVLILLGIIIGIFGVESSEKGGSQECKDFIDSQLPEKFIVEALPLNTYEGNYRKYEFSSWNDGTPVKTCTDNPEVEDLGFGAHTTKRCSYVIYKGTNPGENKNEYYIGRDKTRTNKGFIQDSEDYYLEYKKSGGTDEEGNILEDRTFRISVDEYTIKGKGEYILSERENASFYLEDYSIISCEL